MAEDKKWWERGQRGAAFRELQASPKAEERQAIPKPERLLEQGITTRSTLAHRAMAEPAFEPEPTPDDPAGWNIARRNANAARATEIAKDRQAFESRAREMRETFARKAGDSERDR